MAEAMETRFSTSIDAMIRGYHEYKSIWEAEIDELQCKREPVNVHDPYAVAVVKAGVIVCHVPRKISALCSTFVLLEADDIHQICLKED